MTPPYTGAEDHITSRLMIVADMLEKAVEEVHRTMDAIRGQMSGDLSILDDGLKERPANEPER